MLFTISPISTAEYTAIVNHFVYKNAEKLDKFIKNARNPPFAML